jgi:ribosomal protein S18 acetylase RimI-like enzyme
MQTGIKNVPMWTHFLDRAKCFLYTHEGTIVGMAFYFPSGNAWDVYPDNWAYIRMVGVHPKYEGMGIARSLTQKCIEEARTTDESVIALHTSEVMNAARHIYEKLGFRIVRDMPERFGIKYWLFTLPLTA